MASFSSSQFMTLSDRETRPNHCHTPSQNSTLPCTLHRSPSISKVFTSQHQNSDTKLAFYLFPLGYSKLSFLSLGVSVSSPVFLPSLPQQLQLSYSQDEWCPFQLFTLISIIAIARYRVFLTSKPQALLEGTSASLGRSVLKCLSWWH